MHRAWVTKQKIVDGRSCHLCFLHRSLLRFINIVIIWIDHSPNGAFQGHWNQMMKRKKKKINITWLKTQLVGGRPVGYLQARPRSWTRPYRETTPAKWSEREVLEPATSGFQVRSPNHSATLPPRSPFSSLTMVWPGNSVSITSWW